MSPNLDAYWQAYDSTLARVRAERPDTIDALVGILGAWNPPELRGARAGGTIAFFPGGGGDSLAGALTDARWRVNWIEGDYLWEAEHLQTGVWVHYVEGDLYEGRYHAPSPGVTQ